MPPAHASADAPSAPAIPRLTPLDWAIMAALLLYALVLAARLSHGRIFWEDEMLGWMLLRDPSWHHMLVAYNAGADGGGFAFYLLGRAWFALFGPSPLAFRLFSATCFGLAAAVTYRTLRHFYPVALAAFAVANTWFFSPPFVAHMAEGRFYGLLVLGVALVAQRTVSLTTVPPCGVPRARQVTWRQCLALFCAHALLVTSHLLGVVFSLFLLGALVGLDLLARCSRLRLYLAAATSWLLLWPERANIRASAAVGKPHFWTHAPTAREFLDVYTGSCKEITLVLALLLAAAVWALTRRPGLHRNLPAAVRRRPAVYAVIAAIFLLPLCLSLYALGGGTWLVNDRYMLPVTVAVAYLTAELCALAAALYSQNPSPVVTPASLPGTPAPPLRLLVRAGGFLVFAAALLFWDFHHLRDFSPSPQDYTAALSARLPHNLPVVCEDAFCFTELIGRQHQSGVPYTFLLDWQYSLSAAAPRLEVTQFHLMQNWRRVGYFSGSIQNLDEFLATHPRFLVIHTGPAVPNHLPPTIGNPLAARLARDPAYQVEPYTSLRYGKFRDAVYLVCRGACSAQR